MGHFNTQSGGISTLMAPQAIEDGAKLIFVVLFLQFSFVLEKGHFSVVLFL